MRWARSSSMRELLYMEISGSAERLAGEGKGGGGRIGGVANQRLCHRDSAPDMGEPLFGEPWGKPGLISGIDPEEPPGPSGDEMFDEFPRLPEVGGHHRPDHFAAAEGAQASEPGNVAVAANDGEFADLGEIREQPFAVGA